MYTVAAEFLKIEKIDVIRQNPDNKVDNDVRDVPVSNPPRTRGEDVARLGEGIQVRSPAAPVATQPPEGGSRRTRDCGEPELTWEVNDRSSRRCEAAPALLRSIVSTDRARR
uniref:Uncharacterized protein n=1 Tax=Heliothis virescens TaxID=7102 RepID=A0A2A4JTQ5_HELVI